MVDEDPYAGIDLTLEKFIELIIKSDQIVLLQRAFTGNLTVPDFPKFCEQIKVLYENVALKIPSSKGRNASYIPVLEKVDCDLWGISVCTIDGQRFDIGDARVPLSVQSCIKPLIYCLALEEHGAEKVAKHVGREPSGVAFNSLSLNKQGIPQFAPL